MADPEAMAAAGGFDEHYTHMRSFWNTQLDGIAEVSVPDTSLSDAYKSGFIYTEIARSGNHLNTGVNGYESEFSHDVIGILANMFTQGYFTDAHALLLMRPQCRRLAGPVRRRDMDLCVAVGDLLDEDRGHRFRRGELLVRGTIRKDATEYRGHRPSHRQSPDRSGRDHGIDRRHRLRRLLDG